MTLGIIGGNSQVGSSVAFYLKTYTDIKIICFARSSYSQFFFKLLDIEYTRIDLNDIKKLSGQIKECDTIIDFSYPSGELFSIPGSIKKIFENVISSMPAGSSFIYMSSIMAYGMPDNEKFIKSHFFPRSSYAFIKRKAERLGYRLGQKYKIKFFSFRLGQVHGFLQSVNGSFRDKLTEKSVAVIDGHPDDVTNTVFINSVGEAIINFCRNGENFQSGTYTLVSNPQWTLKELYGFYRDYYKLDTKLAFIPSNENRTKRSLLAGLIGKVKSYRALLETYLLLRLPTLSVKIKGKYRVSELSQTISRANGVKYIDFNLLGKPDKRMIENISSSYNKVFTIEKEMEEKYNNILNQNIG